MEPTIGVQSFDPQPHTKQDHFQQETAEHCRLVDPAWSTGAYVLQHGASTQPHEQQNSQQDQPALMETPHSCHQPWPMMMGVFEACLNQASRMTPQNSMSFLKNCLRNCATPSIRVANHAQFSISP